MSPFATGWFKSWLKYFMKGFTISFSSMTKNPDLSESILVCGLKPALILPLSLKTFLAFYLFVSISSIFFFSYRCFFLLRILFGCFFRSSKLWILSCDGFCNTIFFKRFLLAIVVSHNSLKLNWNWNRYFFVSKTWFTLFDTRSFISFHIMWTQCLILSMFSMLVLPTFCHNLSTIFLFISSFNKFCTL